MGGGAPYMMSRILGIDYGERRVGLALSDETATIGSALEQLEVTSDDDALDKIAAAIAGRGVGKIIIGLPRNMDGSYGPQARKVLAFVEQLRVKISIPVETWDERLTTVAAERAMLEGDLSRKKRKGRRDQIAAQILLQSYLDARAQRECEPRHRVSG